LRVSWYAKRRQILLKHQPALPHMAPPVEDVQLLCSCCSPGVRVKASGGIRSLDTALAMLDAGASRLGVSAGVSIMNEWMTRNSL
jgi:deoxyribose-phosphate aldolase